MPQFLKMFLASLLALVLFAILCVFVFFGFVGALLSKEKTQVAQKSVLVVDLSQHYREQRQENPLAAVSGGDGDTPGLYDLVRLIKTAKTDKKIAGIYLLANGNANSYASSLELRQALLDFKTSKKPVMAHGDVMTQGAYFVASAAGKLYLNPAGDLDWSGFSASLLFLKGTLDRLQIQPQIFYAGKFKSATEPFRTTQMTAENELQTSVWLNDLYSTFLQQCAEARGIDTASLHRLANTAAIQTPQQALQQKLVDGLKYDDEVKSEWKKHLGLGKWDKLNLLPVQQYAEGTNFKVSGKDRIALIYAAGDIVDGEGSADNIGGDRFRNVIRKARLDRSIKAIVLRINSGGGSALASENIWRELVLAKQEKPVVVSMGDVAASGGYYIACAADSIFANANTITGSIGVFTLVPNLKDFFDKKLGVTFDGVKTAEYANAGTVTRPLNDKEKELLQNSVDRIYLQFKERVAQGRKRNITYIDSIAQGRVWSGEDAWQLGLVDRLGGLQQAIDCAARLAKTNNYRLREYPEQEDWLNRVLNASKPSNPEAVLKERLGAESFEIVQQLTRIQQWCGAAQTRLPFSFIVH